MKQQDTKVMTQSVYRSFTQRLLLLMLMMVMSIGSAWGDFTPATLPSTNIHNDEAIRSGNSVSISLVGHAATIKSNLSSNNIKYARWFIADSDNNNVNSSTWTFTQGLSVYNDTWYHGEKSTDGYGYLYWNVSYGNGIDPTSDSRRENILNMTITAPSESDWTGKKVIVLFSNEANSSPNEPKLKTMYVFDIITEAEA